MNPLKSTLIIILSLWSATALAQYTDVINSNRPGASRSAFSVGTGILQFELGSYLVKEERSPFPAYDVDGYGIDFAARYGFLLEALELNIEGTYQNDDKVFKATPNAISDRANFKTLTIGAKYLLYDPNKNEEANKPNLYSWKANHGFKWRSLIPAVAIYAGAHYDTKDNPYTAAGIEGFSPKVMIATQHNFAGGWVLVMNLIKERIGTEQSDFSYVVSLTHALSPKWVIFGETQGIQSDFYADNLFRFGGAFLWTKNFQLDTAITWNVKDTPSVFNANLGLSYRLDFHRDKVIDNGTSAKDEGKRRKRGKRRRKSDEIPPHLQQKRDAQEFGN